MSVPGSTPPADLVQDAARCPIARGPILELAARMSRAANGDADLAHAVERAITHRRDGAALALVLAAGAAGRPLPIDLVRRLLPRLDGPVQLATAVAACTGDRSGALASILARGAFPEDLAVYAHALVLGFAAGGPPPAGIVADLRQLARAHFEGELGTIVGAIAARYGDAALAELAFDEIERFRHGADAAAVAWALGAATRPLTELIPERPAQEAGDGGFAIVRPSAKVGRNEPCPCGSGKKYKSCCAGTQARRAADPSPVVGRILSELDATDVAAALPPDDIGFMEESELATLDPTRLGLASLEAGAHVLAREGNVERAREWLAQANARAAAMGLPRDPRALPESLVRHAIASGAIDAARALAPAIDRVGIDPAFALELELLDLTPGDAIARVSDALGHALASDGAPELVGWAHALLDHLPALGVLVARGLLDLVAPEDLEELLERVDQVRDLRGWEPYEAAWDVLDRLGGGGGLAAERTAWEQRERVLRDELLDTRKRLREEKDASYELGRRVRALEADIDELKKTAGR